MTIVKTSKRIVALDDHLINKIAAGEVIERPASIVKELVENALDANASQIVISIESGGIKSITVSDNGEGIYHKDIHLALSRHATSKLSDENGLFNINTLGFRGEALPSILAVSKFRLTSRTKDDAHGWCVAAQGGGLIPAASPVACNPGTSIEVSELFFNTPARQKFLKAASTEFTHIERCVRQLALSNLNVNFKLEHNHSVIYDLPAVSDEITLTKRLTKLLGQHFVENMIKVDSQTQNMAITGWISKPTFTRSQRDRQYIFLNNRAIKDNMLAHAIRRAYNDVVYQDRHSVLALYITMLPSLVDVNVHPSKAEVRFQNSRTVHDFIYHALKRAIANDFPGAQKKEIIDRSPYQSESESTQAIPLKPNYSAPPMPRGAHINALLNESLQSYKALHDADNSSIQLLERQTDAQNPDYLGYAFGQLHGIYIIAQNANSMILVDIHAAHERINYEKLKHQFHESKIEIQQLLVPLEVKLAEDEVKFAIENIQKLKEFGLLIDQLSDCALVVRGIPALLSETNIDQLLRDVLSDLQMHGISDEPLTLQNAILSSMACYGSIRANRKMSIEEMNALLRQIENTKRSNQCNHGRTTWHELELKQIDKWFKRGQ